MINTDKIILDLCGGTGAWSKPYQDAGYDVRLVTLPEQDVRTYQPPKNVYGILFAMPCTHFSVSGARWWREKDTDGRTLIDTQILTAGLMIIIKSKPFFWTIEQPIGRMNRWLGKPVMYFHPYEYGDPYTKKTALWGVFNVPVKHTVEPTEGSKIWRIPPSPNRAMLRSITPPGFAQAFFEANRL